MLWFACGYLIVGYLLSLVWERLSQPERLGAAPAVLSIAFLMIIFGWPVILGAAAHIAFFKKGNH